MLHLFKSLLPWIALWPCRLRWRVFAPSASGGRTLLALLTLSLLVSGGARAAEVTSEQCQPSSPVKNSELPSSAPRSPGCVAWKSPNSSVLLVVMDDVGVDAVGTYVAAGIGASGVSVMGALRTPELDRLAASGVRFDAAWSSPACSPTRATILTGKFGFRTGIGSVIRYGRGAVGLSLDHMALPAMLRAALPEVRTAFFGKWHLAGDRDDLRHPERAGFEIFRGTVGNLGSRLDASSYFEFNGVAEGEPERRREYATTAVTDDAIAAMNAWKEQPSLVVASYHAAHLPLHVPPMELLSEETRADPIEGERAEFLAMVEALDHEIGRLVAGIPAAARDRTLVLIVGDNGTDVDVAEPRPLGSPRRRRASGKGTLLQSGIHVPLIAHGAPLESPGRVCKDLVHTVDLFATVLAFMTAEGDGATLGVTAAPEVKLGPSMPAESGMDSVSFLPTLLAPDSEAARATARTWLFSERFEFSVKPAIEVDRVALRGPRYKLIENRTQESLRFYDLLEDPDERVELLRAGKMDAPAIEALARLTVLLAGPLGREREAALTRLRSASEVR